MQTMPVFLIAAALALSSCHADDLRETPSSVPVDGSSPGASDQQQIVEWLRAVRAEDGPRLAELSELPAAVQVETMVPGYDDFVTRCGPPHQLLIDPSDASTLACVKEAIGWTVELYEDALAKAVYSAEWANTTLGPERLVSTGYQSTDRIVTMTIIKNETGWFSFFVLTSDGTLRSMHTSMFE